MLPCWIAGIPKKWSMEIYGDLFPGRSFGWCSTSLNWVGISSTCVTWWDPVAPALCSQWHFPRVNDKLPTSLYALIQHIQGKHVGNLAWNHFWSLRLIGFELSMVSCGLRSGRGSCRKSVPAGVKLGFPRLIFLETRNMMTKIYQKINITYRYWYPKQVDVSWCLINHPYL